MKTFKSQEDFEVWAESYNGYVQTIPCVIIDEDNRYIAADLEVKCRKPETAIKRFTKAFESVKEFDGWTGEAMLESLENGYPCVHDASGFNYGVEWLYQDEEGNDWWYVYITIKNGYARNEWDESEDESKEDNKIMTANTIKEAWEIANKLFPTDYERDARASQNAGYPVYMTTRHNGTMSDNDHISDLGDRLEINVYGKKEVNIWIEEEGEKSPESSEKEEGENTMTEYQLTVGLYDRESHKQEVPIEKAESMIADCLLNRFDIPAFTLIHCTGVYTHDDGSIVCEPSIRVEIATDEKTDEDILGIISYLKKILNQESIMIKKSVEMIGFK